MSSEMWFWFFYLCIAAMFGSVQAVWDAGDTIALIIGLVLMFLVGCAGLGWYSRREGYTSTA